MTELAHALTVDIKPPAWFTLLTPREAQVADMLVRGYERSEIASALKISAKTVDTHAGAVLTKLRLPNKVVLTRYAIRNGIVSAEVAEDAMGGGS